MIVICTGHDPTVRKYRAVWQADKYTVPSPVFAFFTNAPQMPAARATEVGRSQAQGQFMGASPSWGRERNRPRPHKWCHSPDYLFRTAVAVSQPGRRSARIFLQ